MLNEAAADNSAEVQINSGTWDEFALALVPESRVLHFEALFDNNRNKTESITKNL
jgi:hypothetical protein